MTEQSKTTVLDNPVGPEHVSDAPWWKTNPLTEKIKKPPTEIYKLRTPAGEIDMLNFAEIQLSPDELAQIVETFTNTASFTNGKIYSRIIGIVIAPEECFKRSDDDSQDRPNIAGDLNRTNPVVRINIDAVRRPHDDSFGEFIKKRAPGKTVTMLQAILAHELGHAMDLRFIDEIQRNGIDVSKTEFVFNGVTKEFDAFEHPDPTIYLLEPSLSQRGRENAAEDFAETFMLAVVGGDVSKVPRKMQRIKEAIDLANGQAYTAPQVLTYEAAA